MVSAIWLLVGTLIGKRRKQFREKDLILASDQLVFRLVKAIFFLHFSETPARFFQEFPYFRLVETDLRANNGFHKQKKAVSKRILFPLGRNSDSTKQNEGFIKKYTFPLRRKAAFTGRNI